MLQLHASGERHCLAHAARISGDPRLPLPDDWKKSWKGRPENLVFEVNVCTSETGEIQTVRVKDAYGSAQRRGVVAKLPPWDWAGHFDRGIRTWRYRPARLDGKSVALCSIVVFSYVIGQR
jgi:hypothetical protein